MVLTGEWFFPRVAGELYADKPPVFMWLVAAFYAATGSLRTAFLLPSILAGLGTLALVYDLARRLWGREAAKVAALLLLFTVQFTLQARSAQLDALVTFFITAGLYGLLRHLLLGPSWRWYVAGWIAMAVGILTKGVGFLPLLLFIPWALMRWRGWIESPQRGGAGWRWAAGPAALLAILLAWVLPVLLVAAGNAEIAAYRDEILLRQTAVRYVDAWHHRQPWWYYFVRVIPWAWLPLTLAAPWLARAWWRRLRTRDPATMLLLGWAACVLLFFTLSPGKRHVYILPALPAVMLAAAPHALEWLRSARIASAARVLAMLAFAGWQAFGWIVAPRVDPMRSGADLMALADAALPAGGSLGVVAWKEQMLLQARGPVTHFGFRREPVAEARDAAAWLAGSPRRRVLLPASRMEPCFEASRTRYLAERHREQWHLAGPEALTGSCTRQVPIHARRYDIAAAPP